MTDLASRPPSAAVVTVRAPWPLRGDALASPWRMLAAVGALGEAVAHIPVIDAHLAEAPYIGVGFVLVTIAGLTLGTWLLTDDTAGVWAATAAVAVLALAAYVLSRTVGLPQIGDDIGNWGEPLGVVAIVFEALMVVAAVPALAAGARARGR